MKKTKVRLWGALYQGTILIAFLLITKLCVAGSSYLMLDAQRSDYIQGMNGESVSLIVGHYAADIRLMPEANPIVLGVGNAKLFFTSLFRQYDNIRYTREKTRLLEMEGYIAEIGVYRFEAKNGEGIERKVEGSYVNLWQIDGVRYRLIADIWNFDHGIDFKHEMQFNQVPSVVTALQGHVPINTPMALELAAYGALSDLTIPLRDGHVIGQFYADDAMILSNYRAPIIGGEAIRAHWLEYAKKLASFETLQSRSDKIIPAGEYVIQFASHIAAWRSETATGVSTGKHLRIWKRQTHGGIRTLVLISAYDG